MTFVMADSIIVLPRIGALINGSMLLLTGGGPRVYRQQVRIVVVLTALAAGVVSAEPDAPISFGREILPILSEHCFTCHGPDEEARSTDLRFDDRESAFADLGGYAAI
ncbi:MAG: c-type cytochrome domain-containing protein, partial [Planctomycetota bacterium]